MKKFLYVIACIVVQLGCVLFFGVFIASALEIIMESDTTIILTIIFAISCYIVYKFKDEKES